MEVIDTYIGSDYAIGKVAEHIVPDMIKNVIVKAFEHSDKSVTISVGADGAVSVEIIPKKDVLMLRTNEIMKHETLEKIYRDICEQHDKGVVLVPHNIELIEKENRDG